MRWILHLVTLPNFHLLDNLFSVPQLHPVALAISRWAHYIDIGTVIHLYSLFTTQFALIIAKQRICNMLD